MRTTCLAFFWMSAFLLVEGASAQEPSETLSAALQVVQGRLAGECDKYRQLATTAKRDFEIQQAQDGRAVVCDCVPEEFDATAKRLAVDAARPPEEHAQRVGMVTLQACGTKHLRSRVLTMCRADTKPAMKLEDRETYCQCVQKALNELSDEQLTSDALKAYEHYEAAVQAVANGQPRPASPPTSLSKIEASCRAQVSE